MCIFVMLSTSRPKGFSYHELEALVTVPSRAVVLDARCPLLPIGAPRTLTGSRAQD